MGFAPAPAGTILAFKAALGGWFFGVALRYGKRAPSLAEKGMDINDARNLYD